MMSKCFLVPEHTVLSGGLYNKLIKKFKQENKKKKHNLKNLPIVSNFND